MELCRDATNKHVGLVHALRCKCKRRTNADTNNAHTFNANARMTDTQAQPKTFSLSRDGICVCVAFRAAHSCAMHEHTNSHCANGSARK